MPSFRSDRVRRQRCVVWRCTFGSRNVLRWWVTFRFWFIRWRRWWELGWFGVAVTMRFIQSSDRVSGQASGWNDKQPSRPFWPFTDMYDWIEGSKWVGWERMKTPAQYLRCEFFGWGVMYVLASVGMPWLSAGGQSGHWPQAMHCQQALSEDRLNSLLSIS